jgi:integrase
MGRPVKKQRGIYEHPPGSGIWWVLYYDQYGRRHREKAGMRSAAIYIYRQRKEEVRQEKFKPDDVEGKHRRATVREIIEDYINAGEARKLKALGDVKQRLRWFKEQIGDLPARSITVMDLENCRRRLYKGRLPSNKQEVQEGGRSDATVNRYLGTLKAAFYLALKNGKVERNPVSLVKLRKENNKRIRYLTEEEEAVLFRVLPHEYHPLVLVALQTGMRKSEQLRLNWADIDFRLSRLTVRQSKSGEARHIPMNTVVTQTLQSLPRMIHNPYVFYGRKVGEEFKNGIKNSDWKKYLKQAGIEDFRWHDLRHTFASRLVMRGVNLLTVSKLLGHSSTEVTERYAHLAPSYLNNAVDTLVSWHEQPPEQPLANSASSSLPVSSSIQRRGPVAQKDRAAVS